MVVGIGCERFSRALESVDENGGVEVPTGPGLGVELDWEWIEKNKTGTTVFK